MCAVQCSAVCVVRFLSVRPPFISTPSSFFRHLTFPSLHFLSTSPSLLSISFSHLTNLTIPSHSRASHPRSSVFTLLSPHLSLLPIPPSLLSIAPSSTLLSPHRTLSPHLSFPMTGIWRQKNVKIKKNVVSFFGADVTSDVGMHVNKGNSLLPSLSLSHCLCVSLSLSLTRSIFFIFSFVIYRLYLSTSLLILVSSDSFFSIPLSPLPLSPPHPTTVIYHTLIHILTSPIPLIHYFPFLSYTSQAKLL